MSKKSYASWQNYALEMMLDMMNCFEVGFAQSDEDGQRLRALGLRDVRMLGNIKYDAESLPCVEYELFALQKTVGDRKIWLAASTHPGEEILVAKAHAQLAKQHANLLTIITPRHPARGGDIAKELSAYGTVALRSRGDSITPQTAFYIADTLGELGLFYRLCEIVFMGGSLVNHGGQNPLEPARLRCGIITGPHTHNFADIVNEMEQIGALARVQNETALADKVAAFFRDGDTLATMQFTTKEWLKDKGGASNRILDTLAPIFAPIAKRRT